MPPWRSSLNTITITIRSGRHLKEASILSYAPWQEHSKEKAALQKCKLHSSRAIDFVLISSCGMHTLIRAPSYTRKHNWSDVSSPVFSHTAFRGTSNPCWGFRIMNSDRAPRHARTLGEWYQKAFHQHPLGPGFRSETAGNLIRRDYNQKKEWMQSSRAMAASLSSVTQSQHIKGGMG